MGDRIEAGTFLAGGALTGGPVTVHGIDPSYLRVALMKLRAMGCDVETGDDWITVGRTRPLAPIDLQTLPHPGFPTDLQAQFMLLAAFADGMSVITENVFENRFMFASELMRMGADIAIEDHHALVRGVDVLQAPTCRPPICAPGRLSCWPALRGRARLACTTSAISIAVTRLRGQAARSRRRCRAR